MITLLERSIIKQVSNDYIFNISTYKINIYIPTKVAKNPNSLGVRTPS